MAQAASWISQIIIISHQSWYCVPKNIFNAKESWDSHLQFRDWDRFYIRSDRTYVYSRTYDSYILYNIIIYMKIGWKKYSVFVHNLVIASPKVSAIPFLVRWKRRTLEAGSQVLDSIVRLSSRLKKLHKAVLMPRAEARMARASNIIEGRGIGSWTQKARNLERPVSTQYVLLIMYCSFLVLGTTSKCSIEHLIEHSIEHSGHEPGTSVTQHDAIHQKAHVWISISKRHKLYASFMYVMCHKLFRTPKKREKTPIIIHHNLQPSPHLYKHTSIFWITIVSQPSYREWRRFLPSILSPFRHITGQNVKTSTARVASLIMLLTTTNAPPLYSWRPVLTKAKEASSPLTIAGPLSTATNTLERFDASGRGSMPLDLPTRLYRRFPEQSIAKKAIAKAKSPTEIPARIFSTPPERSTIQSSHHRIPQFPILNTCIYYTTMPFYATKQVRHATVSRHTRFLQ